MAIQASGTNPSYFGDYDSGTDTDTESDKDWEVDYRACGIGPEWTSGQVDAELFWQNWRRHSKKPVRRVRRFLNRKGKGKGRTTHAAQTTIPPPAVTTGMAVDTS